MESNKNTGKTRFQELVKCPLCNSSSLKYKFSIQESKIFKCLDCKAYLTNQDMDIGLKAYNDINYFEGDRKIFNKNYKNRYLGFLTIINKLKEYTTVKENLSFLEIGPGDGSFSIAAQKGGFKVSCIDVSQIVIDNLKENNINGDLYNGEEIDLLEKFDIVAMKHVLEHLEKPRKLIQSIYKVLNSNGILYIQVPNSFSFDRFYHREKWSGWDIPYHLVHYNLHSLKILLETFGFSIIYRDYTFFNPISHIRNGIQRKDLFGDYRTNINKTAMDERSIGTSIKEKRKFKSVKRIIKTIFSERDIIIIARKNE